MLPGTWEWSKWVKFLISTSFEIPMVTILNRLYLVDTHQRTVVYQGTCTALGVGPVLTPTNKQTKLSKLWRVKS